LNAYGLQVIRCTNREVLSNPAGIYQHLVTEISSRQQMLGSSPDKGRLGGVSSALPQC